MNVLETFYNSKSKDLATLIQTLNNKGLYDKCSYPQLMALWNNEEIPPLMFIGKEPNGWGGGETVDELMQEYKNFNLGDNYCSSPFWTWIWWISEQLGYKGAHPFLYTNLQKISDFDGGPALDEITETENELFNILSGEISVLNPKICIFTSGPGYDKYIERKFDSVKFMPIDGFKENQMVKLASPQLPELSFRIYHPKYLNYHQELGMQIVSKICEISSSKL